MRVQGWYSPKAFHTINPSLIFGLSPQQNDFRIKTIKNSRYSHSKQNEFSAEKINIGGWLFLILVAVGFLGLILATLSKLRSRDQNLKILAIYIATQIPVLFIYHMHLSVGGMADRIYWIMFGYMMVLINTNQRESP